MYLNVKVSVKNPKISRYLEKAFVVFCVSGLNIHKETIIV